MRGPLIQDARLGPVVNLVRYGNGQAYNVSPAVDTILGVRQSYWSAYHAYSLQTGSGLPAPLPDRYYRATCTSPQGGGFELGVNPSNATVTAGSGEPCQPGDIFTLSGYIRASAAAPYSIFWSYRDAAGNRLTSGGPTITQDATNTWQEASAVTAPAPANAVRWTWRITQTGTRAIGDTIDIAAVITTRGPLPVQYADGDSPGWRWLGTAGASQSVGYPHLT